MQFLDEFFPWIALALTTPLVAFPLLNLKEKLAQFPELQSVTERLESHKNFYRILFLASLLWSLQITFI